MADEAVVTGDNNDYEHLVVIQRLKAAIHYTAGRIAEDRQSDLDVKFSRQLIATVSEAAFKYSQTMARDLELFAKHAKRTTVNVDDVLMLMRKSRSVNEHLREFSEEVATAKESATNRRGGGVGGAKRKDARKEGDVGNKKSRKSAKKTAAIATSSTAAAATGSAAACASNADEDDAENDNDYNNEDESNQ